MALLMRKKWTTIITNLGSPTSVANNSVAKLMFYTHCVDAVLDTPYEVNIHRLSDYHRYITMEADEIDQLIRFVQLHPPTLMEGRCFFLNPVLCEGRSNRFIKMTHLSETIASAQTQDTRIIVGEVEAVYLDKRMVHSECYYKERYYDPMQELAPWAQAMAEQRTDRPIRTCEVKVPPKWPFENIEVFSDNVSINVLMAYFVPFWIIGWIIMSIVQARNGSSVSPRDPSTPIVPTAPPSEIVPLK